LLAVAGLTFLGAPGGLTPPPRAAADQQKRIKAPELTGGVGWLNTAGPLRLKDLRGKVVLLDFWTYCCINCMHVLPDLARLEEKYARQLVVIGVHSAKFDNERDTAHIRKAILRYQVKHPVVNDAKLALWHKYGVRSWPSLYLIDPEGYFVGYTAGEGNYELLDEAIGKLIKEHRRKKTLDEKPRRFQLAREEGNSPLFFPGKAVADAASKRLFIADSTHHRIVITNLDGKKIAIAGTGEPGWKDGPFARARFNDPQGMALRGDLLYVADRKNHVIRLLDLQAGTVKTVAGTGEQDRTSRARSGAPREIGLNSPWDLCRVGKTLYIAMAGHHQIWTLDLDRNRLAAYAGTGKEDIEDGPLADASFAQPSGLTTDGTNLYVADSEVSAIRVLPLRGIKGLVKTIVGRGLFAFGDRDGVGNQVRLQHALGVAHRDGKLYVADTYNSKIKLIDPLRRSSKTLVGGHGGWLAGALLSEPAGLSFAGDKLYIADTNAHRIRVLDVKARTISTLTLQGVEAPKSVAHAKAEKRSQ
jgi:thiol-disulfide isomerase/thioredoxin